MATIQKRKNSYLISVSCGYDMNGKQIRKTMTYTPDKGLTEKQIDKEVQRQAVLFEERCRTGTVTMDDNMRFADFAAEWMKHKKADLRPKTYARYESMLPRINAAIGHMKLRNIQPPHLLAFYENLSEGGIRKDTKYRCTIDLDGYLKEHKLSKSAVQREYGVAPSNLLAVTRGKNCTAGTAESIAAALGKPLREVFEPVNTDKPLSSKTILHHHRLISSILGTAVEWGVLFANPCDRTKPPRVEHKEPKYLDEVQAAKLLELLEDENTEYKTAIRLLLFTGLRRGEVLGLEWADVDFDNSTLQVCRSSLYLPDKGVFEDETKNRTSNRVIKLPQTAVNDLKLYRKYQFEMRLRVGDRWQETDRIFTTDFGAPLHPDTLSRWFSAFVNAHSDELPPISLHSLRHTNATLQIASGVPITTVSKRLGHASSVTTGRIYAHAIRSADEAAAEALENILTPTLNRNAG